MKHNLITILLSSVLVACSSAKIDADKSITLVEQGRYHSNIFDQSAAEIIAFDKISQQTFVVNAQSGKIDVLNSQDINQPTLTASLNIKADLQKYLHVQAGAANSVDVANGLLAIAMAAKNKTDAGWIAFYNSQSLLFIDAVYVGSLPDMLAFTKNGKQLIVAIEGEPSDKNYAIDPEGEVAIIDIDWQKSTLSTVVTRLTFSDFNVGGKRHHELPKQLVLNGYNASVAKDLEPEYIAINNHSHKAYVSLQENNAIAVIDLQTKSIQKIVALGFKDHAIKGNELDGNNKDKKVNIKNEPVLGLYQPDSIATVTFNNIDYLLTANEGDDRSDWLTDLPQAECESANFYYHLEDKICRDDIKLKNAFNNKVYAPLQNRLDLSQFQTGGIYQDAVQQLKFSHSITKQFGDVNGDGKIDRLMTFGGRSFSIWDINAEKLVFDSGSDFERITAEKYGNKFNQSHNKLKNEDRSDNKGPEPEALTTGMINGQTYAFIGLERMGGIMVYNISIPSQATFVLYLNNRDINIDPNDNVDSNGDGIKEYQIDAGDLGPEGIKFVNAEDSPTKTPILIVANEVSGTTTFYTINLK
ncbi:choice-of-anchor I family protein [Psychromonas hadalis]|uniref:choice-of-anchor I family protein n=1 Tax=Psychromonas hadalis TaxID=211669 RepID=UPI0003B720DF|nr:choice-of-anchor I family protein [Psychromonas hadalis]